MGDHEFMISEFSSRDGAVVGLIAAVAFFFVIYLGFESVSRGVLVSTVVILGTARIFWPLRRRAWFWVAMICLIILHMVAVALVPLSSDTFSGVRIVPIAAADFVATIALIYVLAKGFEGRREGGNVSG